MDDSYCVGLSALDNFDMLFPNKEERDRVIDQMRVRGQGRSSVYRTAFHPPHQGPEAADIPVSVFAFPDSGHEGEVLGSITIVRDLREETAHSEPGPDKKACLVLGPRANDLFDVDLLARYGSHVQFVFLNSCSSADASFIQRLAERNVPAVAGYAWPIPDQVAAVFSKQFYTNLFTAQEGQGTTRFLEFAFMRARAALYTSYKGESWWTAPLLFMQTLDREEDARRTLATGALP
jgi:hypothetical protein